MKGISNSDGQVLYSDFAVSFFLSIFVCITKVADFIPYFLCMFEMKCWVPMEWTKLKKKIILCNVASENRIILSLVTDLVW